MSNFYEEQVLSVHHWTDTLFSFTTTRDTSFRFKNGQFTMIGLKVGDRPLLRAYSVASTNYDDNLEFFSIKVADGPLTSRLQNLQVGDAIIVGKKAGAQHGAYTPALGMIIAGLVVLPFGIEQAGADLISVDLLPLALTVAALSSALPFALEMLALRRLTALTYGTLTSLEPAIGALSGLVILREQLTSLQWLAIGLVIAASIGTTLTMKAK